jgi:hypothetical protein
MTPKEKAIELYNNFEDAIRGVEGYEWWESAKQCALIAVDLVLSTLSPYLGDDNARDYWQQVKQEIEKL